MIHLDRERYQESGQQIEPDKGWFQKAAAEQELANALCGKGYEFKSAIYAADTVRVALDELFYGKCGYCEYKLTRAEQDVDHYRPKGRVAEANDHPGYYWLAYDWANLVPACIFCNRRRRDRAEFPDNRKLAPAGKADSFPLADESMRARSPLDDLSLEAPLLLDPTTDYPQEHLFFYPDGTVYSGTVKGLETIKTFNLNAPKLYKDRRCIIKTVAELLEARDQLELSPSDPHVQNAKEKINEAITRATSDSAEYAAAARAVIGDPTAFGV